MTLEEQAGEIVQLLAAWQYSKHVVSADETVLTYLVDAQEDMQEKCLGAAKMWKVTQHFLECGCGERHKLEISSDGICRAIHALEIK